jgi:hypothetical protein
MVQIGTVEHVLAIVELEIRTPKKALICRLFSLNDRNFSVAITKPTWTICSLLDDKLWKQEFTQSSKAHLLNGGD